MHLKLPYLYMPYLSVLLFRIYILSLYIKVIWFTYTGNLLMFYTIKGLETLEQFLHWCL